jgi:hypothetical protein
VQDHKKFEFSSLVASAYRENRTSRKDIVDFWSQCTVKILLARDVESSKNRTSPNKTFRIRLWLKSHQERAAAYCHRACPSAKSRGSAANI